MLYREIIAVCSQIHTEHINTLCGQSVELLNVKLAVHTANSGPNWVNISSLRSFELLACEIPFPNCDYMNSGVTTDSWLQLSPSAVIMQYGRKVKHSATECSENESPLKEDLRILRTPWRSRTSSRLHGRAIRNARPSPSRLSQNSPQLHIITHRSLYSEFHPNQTTNVESTHRTTWRPA